MNAGNIYGIIDSGLANIVVNQVAPNTVSGKITCRAGLQERLVPAARL